MHENIISETIKDESYVSRLLAKINVLEKENADLRQKLHNSLPMTEGSQLRAYHRLAKFIVEQNCAIIKPDSPELLADSKTEILTKIFNTFETDINRMFAKRD